MCSLVDISQKKKKKLRKAILPSTVYNACYHKTIFQTEITCKKIPCYKRDPACRWHKRH